MSKTNFDKLVRWDADYYNSLTDDDCIICLTEREVYLVGQIREMLTWRSTRWIGNTLGLDLDLIASNLEYKLAERMTCQNLTKLIEKLQVLENKIDYVFEQTIIDNGDTLPDENTAGWDVTTPEEFAEEYTYTSDGCDTADKDALYGAIYQLVRYVNQVNIDALQELSQVGNLATQIDKLISAATGGLTPMDEVAAYVDFLVNELLEEYEAIVDETLLEEVTCDLFCIGVSSNCNLSISDVINYYGSKIGSTAIDFTNSILSIMQFAATGTFAGDEYFYFMSVFQFITVGLTDHFFGVDSMSNYMTQMAAGANNPDNDWTLLCDECPELYRRWSHDFAYGLGDFTIENGSLVGGRIRGVDIGAEKLAAVKMPFDASWRVKGVAVTHERIGGVGDGGKDAVYRRFRVTEGSDTGGTNLPDGGFQGNGVIRTCYNHAVAPLWFDGYVELWIGVNVSDFDLGTNDIYLSKIEILFELNYAKERAVITEDSNICD
jgi:hypothetical protein